MRGRGRGRPGRPALDRLEQRLVGRRTRHRRGPYRQAHRGRTGRRRHGARRRPHRARRLRAVVAAVRLACGRGAPGGRGLGLVVQRLPQGDRLQPVALCRVVRPASRLRDARTPRPPVAPPGRDGGDGPARRRRPFRQHPRRPRR